MWGIPPTRSTTVKTHNADALLSLISNFLLLQTASIASLPFAGRFPAAPAPVFKTATPTWHQERLLLRANSAVACKAQPEHVCLPYDIFETIQGY